MARDVRMNPRLLLVEDDPVSQAYLASAARGLPAEVHTASNAAEALTKAKTQTFDAWLVDAHLPDASGIQLLSRLRKEAVSGEVPSLAHTASIMPADLNALREAGFDAVVCKPLTVADWQRAICDLLGIAPPLWDDAAALRALNGNAASVKQLRGLFLNELAVQAPTLRRHLDECDEASARALLHRWQASAGFVGAARLQHAAVKLHDQPGDVQATEAVFDTIQALLAEPVSEPVT